MEKIAINKDVALSDMIERLKIRFICIREKKGKYQEGTSATGKEHTVDIGGDPYYEGRLYEVISPSQFKFIAYTIEDGIVYGTKEHLSNISDLQYNSNKKASVAFGKNKGTFTTEGSLYSRVTIPYGYYSLAPGSMSKLGKKTLLKNTAPYDSIYIHQGDSALSTDGCLVASSQKDSSKKGFLILESSTSDYVYKVTNTNREIGIGYAKEGSDMANYVKKRIIS